MKTLVISILTISLLLFGCGNVENEETIKQSVTDSAAEHKHSEEIQSIELNNGEKWKVDSNMMPHIRNMESDINSFSNLEKKDYKSLAEKLQSNIDLLTSNCTMEGKAHDELHKWLLPYIDLVTELSKAQNETEAAKQFENIQTSFRTFNQYFQ
jgi:TolA-binding protein